MTPSPHYYFFFKDNCFGSQDGHHIKSLSSNSDNLSSILESMQIVCICICVYMYKYVCVYMFVCMCVCVHVYMHTHGWRSVGREPSQSVGIF